MDASEDLTVGEWDDPAVAERAYEGINRRVLCYDDDAMVVHYAVEEGAVFPEHEHDETRQTVFVIEGEIELFGDCERRLTAGDSFIVGPGVRHGIRGVAGHSEIVDTFSPPIEDYGRD